MNPAAGQDVFKALIITLDRRRKAMYSSTESLVSHDAASTESGDGETVRNGQENGMDLSGRVSSEGGSGSEDKMLDVSSLSTENENENDIDIEGERTPLSRVEDPKRTSSPELMPTNHDQNDLRTTQEQDNNILNKTTQKMDVRDFIEAALIDDVGASDVTATTTAYT